MPKDQKSREYGSIQLLVVLSLVLALFAFLVISHKIQVPFGQNFSRSFQNTIASQSPPAAITIETEYQNPFDSSNQYINPFEEYKNPFDQLNQ